MKLICNLLLNVIVTIWSFWVFAFGRADFNAPYFKWFVKCWDANDRSGGIVWNEFLATMKYLTLHYIQRHDEAEECYKYTNLVDMTPFTYENRGRYSEDDWDFLVNQIYMAGSSQNTNHKMSSSQQRETDSQERETGSVNEFQSSPEPDINEVPKSKTEEALEPKVEEQPTYEWEEETSSRKWLWILLALLVAGGIGAWYYMSDGGASGGRSQIEAVDSDSIPVVDTSEVYNDVVPSSPLAFLEEFYKGNYEDSEYIKQHVTANVLNKLKRDAEKDGRSGLLATWVFNAYDTGTDGPDLEYEEGPMIVNTNEQDKFCVVYQYNYYDEPKLSRARKVYLTVSDIDAKYLISDYEVESSSSDNTSSIDENIGSSITMKGKVSKYGIHMVLDINIEDVNGYYYYDSQGSENRVMLKGTLADGKLKLKKYDKDGNVTGYFEGEFDGTSYQGDNVNYNRDEALPFIVEIVN